MMGVAEIRRNEPVGFGAVDTCPACLMVDGFRSQYGGSHFISDGAGSYVSVHKFGEPEYPHLRMTCTRCEFTFTSKVGQP